MTSKLDLERRQIFLLTFQSLFYWPSDTMTKKCWRELRKSLVDTELDRLVRTMVDVHNRRAHRLKVQDDCADRAAQP